MAKANEMSPQEDIQCKDGLTAYHATYLTNSGRIAHQIYWPKKARRPPLDLSEGEFAEWLQENGK